MTTNQKPQANMNNMKKAPVRHYDPRNRTWSFDDGSGVITDVMKMERTLQYHKQLMLYELSQSNKD